MKSVEKKTPFSGLNKQKKDIATLAKEKMFRTQEGS